MWLFSKSQTERFTNMLNTSLKIILCHFSLSGKKDGCQVKAKDCRHYTEDWYCGNFVWSQNKLWQTGKGMLLKFNAFHTGTVNSN